MEIDAEKVALKDTLFDVGNIIVEAAPGTGKTFAGVYLACEAYRNDWINERQKTLFLTFSRNARIQIEEEVERFAAEKELEKKELNAICVSNYHSFSIHDGRHGVCAEPPSTTESERRNAVVAGLPAGSHWSDMAFLRAGGLDTGDWRSFTDPG